MSAALPFFAVIVVIAIVLLVGYSQGWFNGDTTGTCGTFLGECTNGTKKSESTKCTNCDESDCCTPTPTPTPDSYCCTTTGESCDLQDGKCKDPCQTQNTECVTNTPPDENAKGFCCGDVTTCGNTSKKFSECDTSCTFIKDGEDCSLAATGTCYPTIGWIKNGPWDRPCSDEIRQISENLCKQDKGTDYCGWTTGDVPTLYGCGENGKCEQVQYSGTDNGKLYEDEQVCNNNAKCPQDIPDENKCTENRNVAGGSWEQWCEDVGMTFNKNGVCPGGQCSGSLCCILSTDGHTMAPCSDSKKKIGKGQKCHSSICNPEIKNATDCRGAYYTKNGEGIVCGCPGNKCKHMSKVYCNGNWQNYKMDGCKDIAKCKLHD